MKKKFIKDINTLCRIRKDIETVTTKLELDIDGNAYNLYWKLFGLIMKAMSKAYSNKIHTLEHIEDWISWFIWENECGKKQFEAGPKNKMIKVKNATDLYKVIFEL